MPVSSVGSWATAVKTSFAAGFAILLAGIPKIIGFLIILILGWIIAALIGKAVDALLHAIKFDELAQRAGFAGFVRDMGITAGPSDVLASLAKWFVRLIVLVAAFDALGLPTISTLLNRILLWIPNLVVALVVLVVGGLLANALARIVRGATTESGFGNPNVLSMLAKIAVWGFAFMIAITQIGIAAALVDTLFMGFVGALALAFGLAFGLGGRDTAAQMVAGWYRSAQQSAPQMQQAAQRAAQQGQTQMETVRPQASEPVRTDGRQS